MLDFTLAKRVCAVCEKNNFKKIGVRGNREYNGADPNASPHIVTHVVRCKECDFIYTNPEIRGLEYLESNHYNDPDTYMKEMGAKINSMFISRINLLKQESLDSQRKLLDVGAGKGEFVKEANQSGFKAVGVEPSPKFCKYGRKQFGVTMYEGQLNQVEELKKEKFDIITLNHVLEHIDAPNKLIKSFHEYLTEDGLLFLEVPNCDSYFLRIADFFYRITGKKWSTRVSPLHPPFHKFGYTPRSISYVLRKNNFQVKRIITYSGSDRASHSKRSILGKIAGTLSTMLDMLGNRELLCVIAKRRVN